jgi:hypothetical protein
MLYLIIINILTKEEIRISREMIANKDTTGEL